MNYSKPKLSLAKPVFIVVFILFTFNTAYCQWQASMLTSVNNNNRVYSIFSDLSKYRYEYYGERDDVVIVNMDSNQSIYLIMDKKKVHYTKTDGKLSREYNPLQSYYFYLEDGVEQDEGFEEILGYNCKKTSIFTDGELLITKWYSEELRITLKLQGHKDGVMSLEIMDISPWKTDPDMFIVPMDFIEVDKNERIINN